jgi:C4-dicarboxylate-specific signal transduction histidine kinase
VTGDAGTIDFEVRDQGAGLSPGVEARLFMPCTSGKKGGGGIGLAISKQLAHSLGAKLELTDSSPSGCTFRLSVPGLPAGAIQRAAEGQILATDQPG